MWAVLRANTCTLILDANRQNWKPKMTVDIINPKHPYYTKEIDNPAPPELQMVRHTYTNSELPADLDAAIVCKHKGVKEQKLLELGGNHDAVLQSMTKITSINQIHLAYNHPQKNDCLDDIFIPLPMMLEWISEEGWDIQEMTQNEFTTSIIFKSTRSN